MFLFVGQVRRAFLHAFDGNLACCFWSLWWTATTTSNTRSSEEKMIQALPGPMFWVAHLFSGRRRLNDQALADFACWRRFKVHILSIDTATSPSSGDLTYEGCTWDKLRSLCMKGAVAALQKPCETFVCSISSQLMRPASGGRWVTRRREAALQRFQVESNHIGKVLVPPQQLWSQ